MCIAWIRPPSGRDPTDLPLPCGSYPTGRGAQFRVARLLVGTAPRHPIASHSHGHSREFQRIRRVRAESVALGFPEHAGDNRLKVMDLTAEEALALYGGFRE